MSESVYDTILFKVLTFVPNIAAVLTATSLKFIWNHKGALSTLTLITGGTVYVLKKVADKVNEYVVYFTFDKTTEPAIYAKFESKFTNMYISKKYEDLLSPDMLESIKPYIPTDLFVQFKTGLGQVTISDSPDVAGYITNFTVTPTPTPSPSVDNNAELINLFSTKYVTVPKSTMSYMSNTVVGSIGVNIPQVIVASIEDAAVTRGNMKSALVAAGSVGLSNLLPSYSSGMWGSGTEKYIAEPIIAGILYSLGSRYVGGADKEGSMLKKFSKGFIIGASSAAVAGPLVSLAAPSRVPSQYSSTSGLRAGAGTASATIPVSYPSLVVS